MASHPARDRLLAYLEGVTERMGAEGFDPDEEELKTKIMPSIVGSVKRLVGGAPADVKGAMKACLEEHTVIPGFEADLAEFQAALAALKELAQGDVEAKMPAEGESQEDPEVSAGLEQDPTPTAQELESFAAIVARLWAIDEPLRLEHGRDYELNHQARAASLSSAADRCREPLFKRVDTARLKKNPCSDAFVALLDNYERDTDHAEVVTAKEQHEMDIFLQKVMSTPHMKYVHKVLVNWKCAHPDYRRFSAQVFDIWFTQYGLQRGGPKSSSGFEHVFVGEEKEDKEGNSTIVGFHNWIQFWLQERKGKVDYRGYVGSLTQEDDRLVSVRFGWDDDDPEAEVKSVSTFLVGSSVAFEFAMLTAGFLGFKGEAKVGGLMLGEVGPVQLTSYSWKTRMGMVIRSVFLEGN